MAEPGSPFGAPRTILMDDRGTALRLTWHAAEGMVVMSLWREDRCVGTFRATPTDVAGVVGYLSHVLAGAATEHGTHLPTSA